MPLIEELESGYHVYNNSWLVSSGEELLRLATSPSWQNHPGKKTAEKVNRKKPTNVH